jgi:hypothetical protein
LSQKCNTSTYWYDKTKFERVGQREQTNGKCQQKLGFKGCLRVDLHNHSDLEEHNHAGMAYIKRIVHSCDKPTCNLCFKRGWAVREAGNAEDRIMKGSKGWHDEQGKFYAGYGLPEHIIVSVPKSDYNLPYEKLKEKALANLKTLGVLGGALIFHMERYHSKKEASVKGGQVGWYVSLHFHVIGFIDGGYSCRHCKKKRSSCFACKDFDGQARRLNALSSSNGFGWIFKIASDRYGHVGERKTIFGTCWYQLNHATIIKKGKRNTVLTWFGVCSYAKLKLKQGDRKKRDVCPICQHELIEIVDVSGRCGHIANNLREWEEPFLDADGCCNWVPKPKCME